MNKDIKIFGTVKEICNARQYGVNNDKYSQDIVLDISSEKHPDNFLKVTMSDWYLRNNKDNASEIIKVGAQLTCRLSLGGRAYNKNGDTMYFNELTIWQIEQGDTTEQAEQPKQDSAAAQHNTPMFAGVSQHQEVEQEQSDNLPF